MRERPVRHPGSFPLVRDQVVHARDLFGITYRSPDIVAGLSQYERCLRMNWKRRKIYVHTKNPERSISRMASHLVSGSQNDSSRANREAYLASNCLAADLPTAAVFHLMRAAEFGIRALGNERGLKIKNVESLEFAQWGQILNDLVIERNKIMNGWSRSPKKSNGSGVFIAAQFGNCKELVKDVYKRSGQPCSRQLPAIFKRKMHSKK